MLIQTNKPRVLVVDDDEVILEMAKAVLEKSAMVCLTARDGGAGLTLAQRERPDLIIIDLSMPIMNGTQTVTNLSKNDVTKNIPVIILTGNTEAESVKKCLSLGVDDYIVKPFVPADLTTRVQRVLKGFTRAKIKKQQNTKW